MKTQVYRQFLRLPNFRGKGRLTPLVRDAFFNDRPVSIVHGLKVHLDPLEWVQADLLRTGTQEPLTTLLYGQLLQPGDTYIDVGAHIGYQTLVARHHLGATGKVIAIEPQPQNCARLLENWRCNGFENLVLYVAAAGARAGFISLIDQPLTDRAKLSLAEHREMESQRAFRVPVITLNSVVDDNHIPRVKLLKVDVEGLETAVFEGLDQAISIVANAIVEILKPELSAPILNILVLSGLTRWRTIAGEDWRVGDKLPEGNLWASRT